MQAVLRQVVRMIDVPEEAGAVQARADQAMDRYADGDEGAFGVLYDELAPRLFRYAMRQTRSRPAAEDVVQQTFLQIHAARDRFARGASVLTWAFAIARRLIIDSARRRGHEEPWGEAGDEAGTAPGLPADEALHQRNQDLLARRELARLPRALRESFQLTKVEELSVAEAAEVLGITRGMVKIRTHRARLRLERELTRRAREPGDAGGSLTPQGDIAT